MSKFQVYKSAANSQFYYRLRAGNGEIIQSGEGYTTKDNCLKGIASVKANCRLERFDKTFAASQYGFNHKALNGEIIGRGEKYTTSTSRDNGINAVIREAPNAPIEDNT
ncbi:YegP family protein [Hymenobacter aerophilus]|uniref:YegP family protein n=1 Tax=Hymenobacter aerophilus TaxID=119644 RepID=UPI00037F01B8|nr:YegP family protein [Hymenobacter aerophilus]